MQAASGAAEGGVAGAHLRTHIMSCNIDNILSERGSVGEVTVAPPPPPSPSSPPSSACPARPKGDVVWRSPPLDLLHTPRPDFVLPCSAVGWRFGSVLHKCLRAMAEPAVEALHREGDGAAAARLLDWADMLATCAPPSHSPQHCRDHTRSPESSQEQPRAAESSRDHRPSLSHLPLSDSSRNFPA